MKKYILLLVIPFLSFGQQNNFGSLLGNYVVVKNHPNSNGVDFKFKKPIDYNEMTAGSPRTIKLYSSGNSSISDRDILFQIYDYKTDFPGGEEIYNGGIFEMIELLKEESPVTQYFEIGKYPGYITKGTEGAVESLQLCVFLENNLFVIAFTSYYVIGPSDIQYMKKLGNSVEFL